MWGCLRMRTWRACEFEKLARFWTEGAIWCPRLWQLAIRTKATSRADSSGSWGSLRASTSARARFDKTGATGFERRSLMLDDVMLKRFETPDEVRQFEKGKFELVHVGGMTIG